MSLGLWKLWTTTKCDTKSFCDQEKYYGMKVPGENITHTLHVAIKLISMEYNYFRLPHGRGSPFKGEFYDNIFVHYQLARGRRFDIGTMQ